MIRAALLLLLLAGSAAAGPARLAVEELRLPPVTLVDQHGRAQRLAGPGALAGPVVMTFAYTACQSICPLGGGIMAELDAALGPAPAARLVTLTIDPGRDTPAALARAAADYGASDNWLWLTGDPADVRRLLDALGANPADLVFHDPLFLVGDLAAGRAVRLQSLPTADDLRALVAAWEEAEDETGAGGS